MIGKLQTNKVKDAVNLFDYIHSVDNQKLADAIAKLQVNLNKRMAISFVNSSGGGGYFQIHSQDLPKLLKAIQQASRAK